MNRPPTAVDDFAYAVARTPVEIDLLANDTDPDSDPLTITGVTQGTFGATSVIQAGARYAILLRVPRFNLTRSLTPSLTA